MSEPIKQISIEEIKALQENSANHMMLFLQRARSEANILLDKDGKFSPESIQKLKNIINSHLAENASYPTILEHLDNPDLRNVFDMKATFNVAGLYGTTVIRPFKERFKIDADWNLLATFFLMTFFDEQQDKSLFDKFSEILTFKGIMTEENKNREISKIITLLMRALEEVGLITIEDIDGQYHSSITKAGSDVLKHLVALDTIVNIMEVQLLKKSMESKMAGESTETEPDGNKDSQESTN